MTSEATEACMEEGPQIQLEEREGDSCDFKGRLEVRSTENCISSWGTALQSPQSRELREYEKYGLAEGTYSWKMGQER